MPFIHVKIAGAPLERPQVEEIQKVITELMTDVMDKAASVAGVLVEEAPAANWSVGAKPIKRAAQVDAIVSEGSNTPEQKARFISKVAEMLKRILGPDLAEVSYIVVHDVPMNGWGYDGKTQESRGRD